MAKKNWIFFIILIILAGIVFLFINNLLNLYSSIFLKLPEITSKIGNLVQESEKKISTPPPLRATKEEELAFLTQEGVIKWTNSQRQKYGLSPFKESSKLDASAELKVKDMFSQQYFNHTAPDGKGVKDLVEKVGYQFITIGENLALGNFKNDEALIQAWMDSPGHRANILNPNYQNIGVAVLKGTFQGETTWLAVQHFGLPLAVCPQPDDTFKTEITTNQKQIDTIQNNLDTLGDEIDSCRPKWSEKCNQLIDEYNASVPQYNNLVQETQVLINKYNNQIRLLNTCVAEKTSS